MKPIIVIDQSFFIYYFKHGLVGLSAYEMKTGVIYGYIKKLLYLANKYKTNRFIFCIDSRKSERRRLYPLYKKKRQEDRTPEDIALNKIAFEQADKLKLEILPALGFKNFPMVEGFEADDIIGRIVEDATQRFIIASLDNDLYQLMNTQISMYNIKTDKLFTEKDFVEKWGIQPYQWWHVKELMGCTGDNVQGCEGVKAKTAIKFINGELPERYKVHQKIVDFKTSPEAQIVSHIVKVPMEGTPEVKIYDDEVFSVDEFIKMCDTYKMKSLVEGNSFDIFQKYFINI